MSDESRGLYRKYKVERTDGSSGPGGKHEDCRYFVLDLEHDEFSVPAIRAYASAAESRFPNLARDLFAMVGQATADLTAQDVEALQEIRAEIVEFGITDRRILNGTDAELEAADAQRRAVALAVLDKLLAREVGR